MKSFILGSILVLAFAKRKMKRSQMPHGQSRGPS
jgi:hypothetical protein